MKKANGQSKLSVVSLKDAVDQIVLAQGNIFIRELLRENKIQIGATKADFATNLKEAIDTGKLTQTMLETWLSKTEGWGNQHIYLFNPPTIEHADVVQKFKASKYAGIVGRAICYRFPEKLTLSTVNVSAKILSITWHKGRGGWERAKGNDFQREEGSDRFEYRAYREYFDRSLVRFEWRFGDPYCAVLIQLPNESDDHAKALEQVWKDLKEAGIVSNPLIKVRLSAAIKALSRKKEATVQSTRLATDGGHVELVATLSQGGIEDVEAIREVRRGVDDTNFATADGMFSFEIEHHQQLSRSIKVQGYGIESRIRIWVQCKREDVYFVIEKLWAHNTT